MRTLDRYIVRTFLTSVLLWLVVVIALRVLLDMFANMDEFAEDRSAAAEIFGTVVRYYSLHSLVYLQELGKVVLVLAAVTTIYMMNRTNELTAILASGLSLRRVVIPIVTASVILSGGLLINQEVLVPTYAQELSKDPDEWEKDTNDAMPVYLPPDKWNSIWYSPGFDPGTGIMSEPTVVLREKSSPADVPDFRGAAIATGRAAKAGTLTLLTPPTGPQETQGQTAPTGVSPKTARGTFDGWFIHNGFFVMRNDQETWNYMVSTQRVVSGVTEESYLSDAAELAGLTSLPLSEPISFDSRDAKLSLPEHRDAELNLTVRTWKVRAGPLNDKATRNSVLLRPQFIFQSPVDGRVLVVVTAVKATWMPAGTEITVKRKGKGPDKSKVETSLTGFWQLDGGQIFCPSDLSPEKLVLQQSTQWLDYLSTAQLGDLLDRSGMDNVTSRAALTRHIHVADPINNLILLLLVVPFILSRERNIKASTGLGILMGLAFYAFVYICRYTGLGPMFSAWLPVWLFAPVAAVMVDSIKT